MRTCEVQCSTGLRSRRADNCATVSAAPATTRYLDPREFLEHVGPDRHETLAASKSVGDLRHVDVAAGVGADPMWGDEVARGSALTLVSEARQHPAAHIHHCDPAGLILLDLAAPEGALPRNPPQLRNVDQAVPNAETRGPLHVGPLFDELARGAEDLDSIVFPVSHENALVGSHPDVVGLVELAGPGAGLTPGLNELAVGGETVDTGVAVSVRNIQIAVGGKGDAGRTVEGRRHRG